MLSSELVSAILRDFRARMEQRMIHVALAEELMEDLLAAAARHVDDPSRLVAEDFPQQAREQGTWDRVTGALESSWEEWEDQD